MGQQQHNGNNPPANDPNAGQVTLGDLHARMNELTNLIQRSMPGGPQPPPPPANPAPPTATLDLHRSMPPAYPQPAPPQHSHPVSLPQGADGSIDATSWLQRSFGDISGHLDHLKKGMEHQDDLANWTVEELTKALIAQERINAERFEAQAKVTQAQNTWIMDTHKQVADLVKSFQQFLQQPASQPQGHQQPNYGPQQFQPQYDPNAELHRSMPPAANMHGAYHDPSTGVSVQPDALFDPNGYTFREEPNRNGYMGTPNGQQPPQSNFQRSMPQGGQSYNQNAPNGGAPTQAPQLTHNQMLNALEQLSMQRGSGVSDTDLFNYETALNEGRRPQLQRSVYNAVMNFCQNGGQQSFHA